MPVQYKYIDLGYIENIAEGKNEIIIELIEIFKKQALEYIEKMNQYLSEENLDALGKITHKAKASAAIMGMTKLAADLKIFEITTKTEKNTLKFADQIKDFECSFRNAIIESDQYISDNKGKAKS